MKSTNGYYKTEIATLMPPTSYLWARRANTGTDHLQAKRTKSITYKAQITFGPEKPTRVQVKSYHLWATKSNQRIKTDIGPQYRAEFDEFCNFNAWTKYIRKTQASVKKVRSDKETTCNNCPGVYCVRLSNKLNTYQIHKNMQPHTSQLTAGYMPPIGHYTTGYLKAEPREPSHESQATNTEPQNPSPESQATKTEPQNPSFESQATKPSDKSTRAKP